MPETFESLLVKLSRTSVDYLVAGGVAVCLNGFVRTTDDIDILIDAWPANVERLLAALATFGQGFARELSPEDFSLEEGAVRLNDDFTVDIFTLMRSRTFADFEAKAGSLKIENVVIRYLAPESLIELKSLSTREKDRLDVVALRQIMAGAVPPSTTDLVGLTPSSDAAPEQSR
ncbi:MAG: DUF6036 family nucleotidyltransferase [Chthoniobacterales bacterium]